MNRTARLQIYTDGGAEPNPGRGGWGAVILEPESGERRELSGGEPYTTNNRMELMAAIAALAATEPGRDVDLHTDSSYLRLGITRWLARWKRSGWRTRDGEPVKNDDLWRALELAASRHRVRWHWVKGHSGHEHNERAHTLAALEIARQRAAAATRGGSARADVAVVATDGVAERGGGTAASAADVEVLFKLGASGGRGAWSARVRRGAEESVLAGEGSGVTSNRLELLAAAEVLTALPERVVIEWKGGSDYFRDGASKWLAGWRRRGYRTSAGDPVKNADAWQALEKALATRTVRLAPLDEEDARELAALDKDVRKRLARAR